MAPLNSLATLPLLKNFTFGIPCKLPFLYSSGVDFVIDFDESPTAICFTCELFNCGAAPRSPKVHQNWNLVAWFKYLYVYILDFESHVELGP